MIDIFPPPFGASSNTLSLGRHSEHAFKIEWIPSEEAHLSSPNKYKEKM